LTSFYFGYIFKIISVNFKDVKTRLRIKLRRAKGGEETVMMNNCCGGYCEPAAYSKDDRKALLKEQASILEAKLATIRHWLENIDKEDK